MSERSLDNATEEIVDELDAVLPGEIDRRAFLHGSAGTIGAMMLAGCAGSGNGNGTNNGSSNDSQTVFTTPWKKEPSWGHAHVAAGRGYWEDAGVSAVKATMGNGSDTEAVNIGTGNKAMGITSLPTALSVYPETQDTEALNMTMVGLARGRPLLSLIWRKDKMNSRSDIAGKSILAASGFAAATKNMYPAMVGVDPSNVKFQEGTEAVGPAKLSSNEVQAIWGSVDLFPVYESEVDAELGVTPLTTFGDFYGFPLWVNSGWYEQKENNVEFMSQVMTGYFKALKWGLLNQDAYLKYLKNEVNPNLKTWTEEELKGQHSVNCAQAVTVQMKDKGLGYFAEDGVSFVLEKAGPTLVENPDALPSASDLVDMRAWKQSEKVTFSDSEWNTLAETAGPIWDIFASAPKEN